MIETALIRIRGERFLFRSFDNRLGEQPEADRETHLTPGISFETLPVRAGDTEPQGTRLSTPVPGSLRSLSNLPHLSGVARGH